LLLTERMDLCGAGGGDFGYAPTVGGLGGK
jgi:hypothetical protein